MRVTEYAVVLFCYEAQGHHNSSSEGSWNHSTCLNSYNEGTYLNRPINVWQMPDDVIPRPSIQHHFKNYHVVYNHCRRHEGLVSVIQSGWAHQSTAFLSTNVTDIGSSERRSQTEPVLTHHANHSFSRTNNECYHGIFVVAEYGDITEAVM